MSYTRETHPAIEAFLYRKSYIVANGLNTVWSKKYSMQVLNKKCSLPIKSCRICGMLDPEGDNVCPLKGEVSEDFVCDHWVKRV